MKHDAAIVEVPCSAIAVVDRHRKDMGDISELAASINTEGLLQPIGITEKHQLVFGERRLRAMRDVLKWTSVPARIVRVSSILAGEYAENELRKDFTPSERVAIAEAVRAAMPERRGASNVGNCPQLKDQKTRDIAAEKAGFSSPRNYERAKSVVTSGTPELVAAMDSGEMAVSSAAIVARQPAEEQKRIVELPKPQQREAVSSLRFTAQEFNKGVRDAVRKFAPKQPTVTERPASVPTQKPPKPTPEQEALNNHFFYITRAIEYLASLETPIAAIAQRIADLDSPDKNWTGLSVKAAKNLQAISERLAQEKSSEKSTDDRKRTVCR